MTTTTETNQEGHRLSDDAEEVVQVIHLAERVLKVYEHPNGELPEHIRPRLAISRDGERDVQNECDAGLYSTDAATMTTVLNRRGQDMATITVALALDEDTTSVSKVLVQEVLLHAFTTLPSRAALSIQRSIVDGVLAEGDQSGTVKLADPDVVLES